jgi:D-3-phosphoglycerate dehydrogenase
MKILVADKLSQSGIDVLSKDIDVDIKTGLSEDEIVKIVPDYEGLIVRSSTQVTKRIIEAGKKLRVIGRAGVGVDNIDVEAATKKGIVVMNTPLGNITSAGEHTIALLMALARNIPKAHQSLKQQKWEKKKFTGVELNSKTLGIIGLGKVGSLVAKAAHALSMNIIVYDPFIAEEKAEQMNIRLVEFDDLIRSADFITVHTPLTDSTRNLIGEKQFAMMKDNVRIINAARGGIINEAALYNALKSGKVAGAALDVFEQEPPEGNLLLELENVVVTPHLGAATEEAQERVAVDIAEQFVDFFRNNIVRNAVNMRITTDEQLKPYLGLAEIIGSFASQLRTGHMDTITVACYGPIARRDTRAVTVSALKGLLKSVCADEVNLINAPFIAKQRGITIEEKKSDRITNYVDLVTVTVADKQSSLKVAGTLLNNVPRIVKIDDFEIDLKPAEHILLFYIQDRPGIIGKIGTIMGRHNINIARMEVGRKEKGKAAIVSLTLDSPASEEVLAEIQKAVNVKQIRQIRL